MNENRAAVWSYLCSVLLAQMTDDQILAAATALRFRGIELADEAGEELQRMIWEVGEAAA